MCMRAGLCWPDRGGRRRGVLRETAPGVASDGSPSVLARRAGGEYLPSQLSLRPYPGDDGGDNRCGHPGPDCALRDATEA